MTPTFLYGTAWKEDDTARCVRDAIAAGFRAIDTANQRKHYFEAAVGQGIVDSGVTRGELWLQTKFTYIDGQDQRLPYDPSAPIATQVEQSFASSCEHLATERIDSFVLHGPSQREGLGRADHEAWRTMEALVTDGRVGAIGISNATAKQVAELVRFATIQPTYVQNRCYARTQWDVMVRTVCREHDIVYQGFSLLTANRDALAGVGDIAERHGRTRAQIIFRFAQQIGMLPLTGTTDPAHMHEDLAMDFELSEDEMQRIETIA
jgi:diketogulonate reductase-like aldo/keto reductase